jgi:hypothetical protein
MDYGSRLDEDWLPAPLLSATAGSRFEKETNAKKK